jgi:hypothetical protein
MSDKTDSCGSMDALPVKGETGYPSIVPCELPIGHGGFHRTLLGQEAADARKILARSYRLAWKP